MTVASRNAALFALSTVLLWGPGAHADGPPVAIFADPGVTGADVARVQRLVAARRPVVAELPLPRPDAIPAARAEDDARVTAIRLALGRARAAKGDADWDGCVREAESVASDAIELLASAGELTLLRDLDVEVGTCLTLAGHVQDARIHFAAATLLDETEPEWGRNKEAAEKLQAEVRAEVLARRRGKVHVDSEPPGADVFVDGRKQSGATPLDVDVRAGDHFVTVRRFRWESRTDRRLLQPDGSFRVVLEPASRSTIEQQLAHLPVPAPPLTEQRLAHAVWWRAEQALTLARARDGALALALADATTGTPIRGTELDPSAPDAALAPRICRLFGESCEPRARGVPVWVWPLVGGVVLGAAALTTGIILWQNRDFEYCPAQGCR